jgi:hypothetical protein
MVEPGTSSRSSSTRFGTSTLPKLVMPVILPPGRLKLSTMPSLTGSSPMPKTMGVVEVAALAARATGALPAKIKATARCTSSDTSAGKRSN